MRKFSILALGAMIAAPAMAATSTFDLVGTSAFGGALPTQTITVGPDVFGGVLQVQDTVLDLSATGDLSANIMAPTGGVVDVFLRAAVSDDSAGLFSFVTTITGGPGVSFTSGLQYDVPFEDVPGRPATFSGFPTTIPTVRAIAGELTTDLAGHFNQALTSPFSAADGAAGLPAQISEAGAGGFSLVTTSSGQTFGIGQVGNDQTDGPTILGHFTVEVPAPAEGGGPQTYDLSVQVVSNINWVQNPQFGSPIIPNQVQPADAITTLGLTITVPEPATALLLMPAAAIIRRRRRA